MFSKLFRSLFYFILFVWNVQSQSTDPLKLVILIHRHGDRTPFTIYPRDPYADINKYWPDGVGELTISGKERMYNLGKYLAKRYNGFLGSTPKEVFVRSSAKPRCLESAGMILAAIYPPTGRWRWNNDLGQLWQPFSIETVAFNSDGLLNPDAHCKLAEKEAMNIYHSNEAIDYTNKVRSTLNYVQSNTGLKSIDLISASFVYDTLMVEKLNNLQLPPWVDKYTYAQLQDISTKTFYFDGMTPLIQKLRSGKLLKAIGDVLKTKNYGDKRFYIYSTHDTMLAIFLHSLGNFNNLAPPFGASILFEIRQNTITNENYIQLFYLNVTESEKPYQLSLPDCQSLSIENHSNICTVNTFLESIKNKIPNDWHAECEGMNEESNEAYFYAILTLLFIFILMIVSIFIYNNFVRNRRRHINFYKMLPVNF